MPRYDDDQCAQCGGIRVAKSTLCADCLVALRYKDGVRRLEMEKMIEGLKANIKEKERFIDEILNHEFKQNQKFILLMRSHKRLEDRLREVMKDGKDRKAENTGL